MYSLLRPFISPLDPEFAHAATLRTLQAVGSIPPVARLLSRYFAARASKPVRLFGLDFPNQVGLAAGYDKNALAILGLAALGFGHIETGSVTPVPQPGNSKPRLFRLSQDHALINRLGFPSKGAEFVARRLAGRRESGPVLGVNLGINKSTPLEQAPQDYLSLMEIFSPLADYLAINISSPNTAGLRELQMRDHLENLLSQLVAVRRTPLLVKLSPDLTSAELEQAIGIIMDKKIDGVIATNTTLARTNLKSRNANESGGLSGAPLGNRSREVISQISRLSSSRLPIIAVGGIMTTEDAMAGLDAGASLVQIYTGLIYRGPRLVKELVEKIAQRQAK